MKILLVHNYYRSGTPGGEDVVFDQERALLKGAGFEVVSYTRHNDEMQEGSLADALRVSAGLRRSRRTRRELGDVLARERPQIAHFHNTFPLISASGYEACLAARVPVVQTVHNYRQSCAAATHYREGSVCEACTPRNPWPAVRHRCYRDSVLGSWAVARMIAANARVGIDREGLIDRYIVLTEFAAGRLRDAGIAAERIVVKPNFIEIPAAVESSRKPFELPYAVFSGRLSREKGILTLITAWSRVEGLALKIIGDGPLRAEAERRAKASGLPIDFLGMMPRKQALDVVAGAFCQVIPSEWFEGMPMVALEAWALGVPVVAAKIGGLAEMIGEDRQGLGFRAGDADDLAARVNALCADAVLVSRLAERGREAADKCRAADTLSILEQVYRSLSTKTFEGRRSV